MLVFQVLQDLSFLTLSGVGLYALRGWPDLQRRPALTQALIGGVLSSVFVLISTNAPPQASGVLHLDAGLGPLFFAGYLGGALGAAIAAAVCLLLWVFDTSPVPVFGTVLYLSVLLFGLLAHHFVACKNDSYICRNGVLASLVSLAVGHALAQVALAVFDRGENTPDILICLTLGGVSMLAAAAVVAMSDYLYKTKQDATELAYRLEMATKTGRMGLFEHIKTASDASFDQGMMRLYQLDGVERHVPMSDWIKRIHPDDQAKLMKAFTSVTDHGSDRNQIEFRGVMPDGSIKYIQAHWVVERDYKGNFVRAVGVHLDLTETKQFERGQTNAERWLAAIASNLPGAVMVAEKRPGSPPKLVYVSDYCEEIWGYSNQEIIDDPDLMISTLEPDDRDQMLGDLKTAAQSLGRLRRRCKISTKDGTVKWLDYHGNSVCIDNAYIRTDSIILDVTAEVLAQTQLREQSALAIQAQKMESIGQLTGGVAHDFNNLLAVIVGNLELLGEELDNKDQLKMTQAAVGAALRGADLTGKMLAFARRSQLEPQTIDLNAIVRDTQNWAGRTLPANVTIETSLLAGLWPIKADQASTESALLNLILNARDAMPNGGRLTLATSNVRIDDDLDETRGDVLQPGSYVMLAVSDTGSGIDPKVLAFVFEPFYTTKAPGAGSGLGLSMVQGFMHQTGGTVRAVSEAGVGTTFKLFFPVGDTPEKADHGSPSHGTIQQPSGARILIAEDQSDVLEVLVQILTRAGYLVTAAPSGDQAKDVFKADPDFDMLLTDIVMPGRLQGTMLAHELRELKPDLPVVFMSGYASEAVGDSDMRPEDIRLMKPVQKRDLLDAIEGLVSRPMGKR